ncbi:MAG: TRAM domain-containing protein [Candidatus Algichlamydia australiensis]|nr:TRAM domain-containing protein [Chlamydiales bacterium]
MIPLNFAIGAGMGLLLTALFIGFDVLFRRFNLRAFNISIIGLFVGYLMGLALTLIFSAILDISAASVTLGPRTIEIIEIGLFLFGIYLGTIMTLRSSDEIYISIPFVKLTPKAEKKKDILLDSTVLSDPRLIDLCTTGLLDHQLILPRFLIKELYADTEGHDEAAKESAKRSLDVIEKLEDLPNLSLRYNDTDFPEEQQIVLKLLRLARLLDANIITADITRMQNAETNGTRFINMHALSTALKPLTESGKVMKIKIQRPGKEPRQGVGYLEDGTMVVVNGGGDFINQTIDVTVLSVNHTTSGRIIFCNLLEDSSQ